MRLQILHETSYVYSTPVHAIAMEARLQPCNDEYQSRQRFRLIVSPKAMIEEYTAFSDIQVNYWTLLKVSEVHVVAESVVDVRERPLTEIPVPPIELDPIEFYPYLQETPLTKLSPLIEEFTQPFRRLGTEDWYQATLAVREAIHKTLSFGAEMTSTETNANDVLKLGRGVCQDFTHLMLSTLRCLGIPARYVSGYLNPQINPESQYSQSQKIAFLHQTQELSEDRIITDVIQHPLRGTGASHAWVEVYCGQQAGWRGFDASNNLLVDQNFVRIGAGRDYRDITPVKGVHKGPAEEDLEVTVTISRVA